MTFYNSTFFCFLYLSLSSMSFADIKGLGESMEFKLNDNTEMTLTDQGLNVSGNARLSGNLNIAGGLVLSPTLVSGNIENINLTQTSLLLIDTSLVAGNVTLPYSGNALGQTIKLKATSGENSVRVRAASCNIDGQPFLSMQADNKGLLPYLELMAFGEAWHVLNSSGSSYGYPSDGLLLYYDFNEVSGTTAITSSDTSAYAGTVTNTSFSDNLGVQDGALAFDGTNDYVDFGDPAADILDPSYVTVSVWVKIDSLAVNSYLVSKSRDVSDATLGSYSLRVLTSGLARAEFWSASDNLMKNTTATTALSLDTWSHLAMTYDGSTLIIYVNGVQDNSTSVTGSIYASSRNLTLGALAHSVPNHFRFDGLMDEVFIYSRALSASEISTLYERGR